MPDAKDQFSWFENGCDCTTSWSVIPSSLKYTHAVSHLSQTENNIVVRVGQGMAVGGMCQEP